MPTYIGVGPQTTDFGSSITVDTIVAETALTSVAGTVRAGGSTTTSKLGGVLEVDIVSASTTAVTTEEILFTRSIAASTLATDGAGLYVEVAGTFAATATTKTVKLHFGATAVTLNATTAAPNGIDFSGSFLISRTSATAQLITKGFLVAGAVVQATGVTTAAETLSAAVTLKVTGQNGTANAGDIVLKSVVVRVVNV